MKAYGLWMIHTLVKRAMEKHSTHRWRGHYAKSCASSRRKWQSFRSGHATEYASRRRVCWYLSFRHCPLTFAALANGFLQVPDSVRARLDKLERVELCVFLAAELEAFQKAHHDILASQPDSSCNKNDETPNWKCGAASIDHDSASVTASSPRQSSGLLILASTPDHSFPQNVFLVYACPRSPVLAEAELLLSLKSTGTEALLPLGARVPWLLIRIATPRMRLRHPCCWFLWDGGFCGLGQPVTQLLNHHLSTHTTRQQMQAMATQPVEMQTMPWCCFDLKKTTTRLHHPRNREFKAPREQPLEQNPARTLLRPWIPSPVLATALSIFFWSSAFHALALPRPRSPALC
eukprot:g3156.t1